MRDPAGNVKVLRFLIERQGTLIKLAQLSFGNTDKASASPRTCRRAGLATPGR